MLAYRKYAKDNEPADNAATKTASSHRSQKSYNTLWQFHINTYGILSTQENSDQEACKKQTQAVKKFQTVCGGHSEWFSLLVLVRVQLQDDKKTTVRFGSGKKNGSGLVCSPVPLGSTLAETMLETSSTMLETKAYMMVLMMVDASAAEWVRYEN